MLRNRLRTLEQQVNAADLPDDAKVKLQSYITGCYGSLTSFNVVTEGAEKGSTRRSGAQGGAENTVYKNILYGSESFLRFSLASAPPR